MRSIQHDKGHRVKGGWKINHVRSRQVGKSLVTSDSRLLIVDFTLQTTTF